MILNLYDLNLFCHHSICSLSEYFINFAGDLVSLGKRGIGLSDGRYYYPVGSIDDRRVEACEVYLSCGFGIVSHTFRDYGNRYSLGFRDRSPAMAGDIHCQVDFEVKSIRDFFQVSVYVVSGVSIHPPFVFSVLLYDRE